MLTPNELEAASMWLDEPMRKLERQVMEDIIRRIKINGEITRAADWQINRLTQLGILRGEIDEAIKNALDLNDRGLSELYAKAIHNGYIRSQALYKAVGKQPVPFAENGALQQLIFSVTAQTRGTMQNITQSLGFAVRDVNGRLYWNDLSHYCQQTLDNAVLGIASGLFDYNTVIKRTVSEMTNSGLRTFDYATGWKNRVDVAARRAVMTGLTQLTGQLNEQTAADLDTEYFEVSLHGGARPEHAEWQGRVWTKRQLETECGLGSVTGLCGANCRHNYYPFVPGISERTYTDEYLDEFKKQQAEKHEFNGKKYDAYQATQRQRALETTMRAQRQKIHLLEAGGADEQDIINARAQYRKTSGEYTRFSREMGLPQQRERVTVDGLGAVGVGKTKGAKEIPQIRPAPIGAKRRGKVSDAERDELLYRGNNKLLTNAGNGGIIEQGIKMSAPKQTPPDFSKYKVKTDLEAVESVKKKLQNTLEENLAGVNFNVIQNADALSPFANQLIKIYERTGMKFPRIVAREIIDNDPCCIASFQPYENTLYISSKYFNSKKALETTLKQWAKDKIMPKQATNIAYLAEHESAHVRIPLTSLHKEKAIELFNNRTLKNSNDRNIIEYFADTVAIYNRDAANADENILNAITFLREEGVKI